MIGWFQQLDVVQAALVVSGLCLLGEAFFALSEISIISCDRLRLRREASEGSRTARILEQFLQSKQRLLATTLCGTQLTIVVSTVVMTYALHRRYGARGELYLLLGLVPMTVIFGEIVPKSLARQHSDQVARLVAVPLFFAQKLFWPLVYSMTAITSWLTRRMGLAERKLVTREELGLILQGPATHGMSEGERKMISRIFDFKETTVGDVMVPLSDVTALPAEATLADLAAAIDDKQYTRYPVYRERVDHVVGIVHAFDVLKAGSGGHGHAVGDFGRAPIFVPQSKPAVDLLVELQRSRQSMAIVVDEYGGAIGIATVEDVLEEIVGPIDDEHDNAPSAVRKEADGVWRVGARTPVADLNRQLGLGLPEGEDYTTIGGLMLERLKHIPREGESIRVGGLLLRVTRATDRGIDEVLIRIAKKRDVREPTRS